MSAPLAFHPLELRLAPEWRRCAVYVVVGFVLVAAVVVGLNQAEVNKTPWVNLAAGLAVLGVAVLVLVALVFRYRIRIDQHGVWRRRLFRWDLWPWEAFEAGKIRHGKYGDQIAFPDKPRYWRTMSASLLGERDRAAYETVVRRYRVPLPPPELPEVVAIKLGLWTRLELSADGVRRFTRLDETGELIPWRDVVRAEAIRATHDRPDFATLELHLPGEPKPVRLDHHQGTPTWKGADAEVIARYLERHLVDGRFQVTALRGPPANEAEADRRLARLAEGEQQLRMARRFMRHMLVWGGLILGVVMFDPWNRPNPANWGRADWLAAAVAVVAATGLLAFHAVPHLGLVYFRGRDLRRDRDAVLRWRADRTWTPAAT
ncbi:MAG TPA: hypothetical protein VKD90_26540 [Gemmataceae bacterium]|nr:hypothetical protein [Gemmataceae bacterium]